MGSHERMVRANGVDLCVETFGDGSDPAVLLIGGTASSMDYWEDEFCARLAGGGRYVIRYDLRAFPASLPVDEAAQRALAGRVFDRTTNIAASQTNHWILDGGEPVRARLSEITAPTLVLHGTEDPRSLTATPKRSPARSQAPARSRWRAWDTRCRHVRCGTLSYRRS